MGKGFDEYEHSGAYNTTFQQVDHGAAVDSNGSAGLHGGRRRASASTLLSRNVTVSGRRTSMRLEPAMWDALRAICRREGRTMHEVCTMIDERRQESALTAATRVFIMAYFRAAATDEGHARAGHGRTGFAPHDQFGRVAGSFGPV